jgi:hypothetical protein
MVAEGSVQIIWTIYFVFISQNAETFLYFCTVLNFLTAISCFFIVESPRYLYSTRQFERCATTLQKIARLNGVPEYAAPNFEVDVEILVEEDVDRNTAVNEDTNVASPKGLRDE